jgi:hypothetical protein
MAKKTKQPSASFLQKFWLPIILAIIALLGTVVTLLGPILTARFSATATPPLSSNFDYQVRIETKTGDPIENANVRLEIGGGKAPLDSVADSAGLARIFIDASYSEKPGRLIVKAIGYKTYVQNIDLPKDDLPKVVQLELVP